MICVHNNTDENTVRETRVFLSPSTIETKGKCGERSRKQRVEGSVVI